MEFWEVWFLSHYQAGIVFNLAWLGERFEGDGAERACLGQGRESWIEIVGKKPKLSSNLFQQLSFWLLWNIMYLLEAEWKKVLTCQLGLVDLLSNTS